MMDPTLLPLFSTEEILDRLGEKRCTGCFHVFTPRESANVFFREGIVVAAANGSAEGVDVLKHILDWKEARYAWQPEVMVTTFPFKPMKIAIREFLAQQRPGHEAPKKSASGPLAPAASEPLPIYKSIPSKGTSTGQLRPVETPGQASMSSFHATQPVPILTSPVEHTATKNFNSSAQSRSAHDAALLNKHKLVLVSTDNKEQRFKITRVSGLIGRNPACDIPVPHPSVSRQHCVLQILDRGLHVKDLGTTNGTKVNGIALTEGYVNIGDKLTLGHLNFVVEKDT